MEPRPDDLFRPMEGLLKDWLAGARLREIVHLVHLIRAELARRGSVFLWSINQGDPQIPRDPSCEGNRRADADGTDECRNGTA